MTENLHGIAQRGAVAGRLTPGDLVRRHGLQRRHAAGRLHRRRGCASSASTPPTSARYAVEKGYDVVRNFFTAAALRARHRNARPRSSRSIAMFFDLEDAPEFVEGIAATLAEDGVSVIELSYMPTMLGPRTASTRSSTSTSSTTAWPSSSGCSTRRASRGSPAELNDVNGGWIRLFMGHRGRRQPTPEARRALQDLRVGRVRARPGLAGAVRTLRQRGRARPRRTARPAARRPARRGQEGPRLRGLDDGQHDPSVHRRLHRG